MNTKTKVLLVGPVCNLSGYSEHARLMLDSLLMCEDSIDLYVQVTQWAKSTYSEKYHNKYKHLIQKTQNLFQSKVDQSGNVRLDGYFDASYQVCAPNEFRKISDSDVGVTAALETTAAPEEWIPNCNMMKHIFVVSEHAKKNLKNSKGTGGTKITTPITVIPFGFDSAIDRADVYGDLELTTKFNFLTVSQFAPRKNIENLIRWFVEEFEDESDVGLIIKAHFHNNSTLDFYTCRNSLQGLLTNVSTERKCKVYLVHGNLSEQQMMSLYDPSVVDCYLTTTHGEGFGIPIFNSACNGIPVIATNWSGHLDFLRAPVKTSTSKIKLKSHFLKVGFDIMNVQQHHLMPGLIVAGSEWAYPRESSFKKNLRFIRKNKDQVAEDAQNLKNHLLEKYSIESVREMYKENILKTLPEKSDLENEVEKMFSQLSI
jgi:glycosyltransferase involved in cell wall biosynthesis